MHFNEMLAVVAAVLALLSSTATARIPKEPVHVTSDYNVPGGYYAFTYSHGPLRESTSCYEYSRSIVEPLTKHYAPRSSLSFMDGEFPRAFWQWSGNITLEDFKLAKQQVVCDSCMILHYLIKDRRLYIAKDSPARVPESRQLQRLAWEEMLSVLLYLYPMPDVEFLLRWDDDCTRDLPYITPNICRDVPRAGFTMPSFGVWQRSMGPVQMASYHSCIWNRYPPHSRKPWAVWRGSTTGAAGITPDNYLQVPRIRLHLLALNHTDLLDAQITRFTDNIPEPVRRLIRLAEPMDAEDYNRFAVILDVDGNGWSDRFGHSLIHYATPVLKMASNNTAFFEHLMAPGAAFLQFNRSMGDLPQLARRMVDDVAQRGASSHYFGLVRNMQGAAQRLMDHVGLAEALAYSLVQYSRLATWVPGAGGAEGEGQGEGQGGVVGGFEEVPMTCCSLAKVPMEFAAAVTSRLMRKAPAAGAAAAAGAEAGIGAGAGRAAEGRIGGMGGAK